MAYADRDNAIDPIVLRRRSLEQGTDAEIVARWIDDFTFLNSLHHIGWTVAHTTICHAD